MARLAGFNSPSNFAKERLLALLAVEESENRKEHSKQTSGGIELRSSQQIKLDLSRLHNELQAFIAESLSAGSYADEEISEMEEETNVYPAYAQVERLLEEDIRNYSAGLQFRESIQHQLAPPKIEEAGNPEESPLAQDTDTVPSAESIENTPTTKSIFEEINELPTPTDYPADSSSNIPFSDSEPGSAISRTQSGVDIFIPDRPFEKNNIPAPPLPSTYETISDELEELAERAFAISPRLGASPLPQDIDKEKPLEGSISRKAISRKALSDLPVEDYSQSVAVDPAADQDPLSELLDETLLQKLSENIIAIADESSMIAAKSEDFPSAEEEPAAEGQREETALISQLPKDPEIASDKAPDTETQSDLQNVQITSPDHFPPPRKRKKSEEEDSNETSGGPPPKRSKK